jgi:peroxiredoxin
LPEETFRFEPPAGAVQVARNELVPPPGLYPMVGKMAPSMALELLDGGRLNLDGDKGKHVIILAFRDPEYPEYPSSPGYLAKVAELARAFQGEDARFYAVCPQESLQAMRELLEKAPLDIPIALDPQERVAEHYLVVPGIPSTVVIDKQGKVQVVQIGFEPAVAEQLRRQIRDVLDGKDLAKEAISQERRKPSAQTHGTKAGEQNRPSPSTQKAEVGEKEKPPLQSHGAGRT